MSSPRKLVARVRERLSKVERTPVVTPALVRVVAGEPVRSTSAATALDRVVRDLKSEVEAVQTIAGRVRDLPPAARPKGSVL